MKRLLFVLLFCSLASMAWAGTTDTLGYADSGTTWAVWNHPTHESTCEICGATITVEGSGESYSSGDAFYCDPILTTARTISFERAITVCEECYKAYDKHITQSLGITWDTWLKSIRADHAQDRYDKEMARKQEKIKALEQEIKYLRKGE